MAINDISLTAGMRTNLRALQSTALLMDRTQERLSTGKRVNSPIDDPVNFFTASAHMQRASDLSLRKDGMSEAIQTIKSANAAYTSINSLLNQAKGLAGSALQSDPATATALQAQFDELRTQIDNLATDAGYKGINLLDINSNDLTVEFAADAGASTLVYYVEDGSTAATGLNVAAAGAWVAAGVVDSVVINLRIAEIDNAIEEVRTRSTRLGTYMSVIQTRQVFTAEMIDTLKVGADNLTLADMNEESANMLMLETRQQLGVASLGMSTDYAQSILRLFQ